MSKIKNLAYLHDFRASLMGCVHYAVPSDQISRSIYTTVAIQVTQSSMGTTGLLVVERSEFKMLDCEPY